MRLLVIFPLVLLAANCMLHPEFSILKTLLEEN